MLEKTSNSIAKEGSAKELSNLKDSYSNKKLAKVILEADVKSKKTEIKTSLGCAVPSSEKLEASLLLAKS